MARVEVVGGSWSNGQIEALDVRMYGLPPRRLDRDTAIAWMREGHSFIPVIDGVAGPALALVEVPGDDGDAWFIRVRPDPEAADSLPFPPA